MCHGETAGRAGEHARAVSAPALQTSIYAVRQLLQLYVHTCHMQVIFSKTFEVLRLELGYYCSELQELPDGVSIIATL